MTDVFVSYRRSERDRCNLIAERLRGLGLNVWFDAELEGGQHFPDVIDTHVHAAKAVIVLWSPAAIKSQWVKAEASIGLNENKLVAVMIENVRLPVPFNNVHTVDLTRWTGDAAAPEWIQVLRPVSRLTGKQLFDPAKVSAVADTAPRDSSRRTVIIAGAGVAGAAALGTAAWALWPRTPAITAGADLTAALDRITTGILELSPEFATSLAVPETQAGGRYMDRLSDGSRAGLQQQKQMLQNGLAALQEIDRAALSNIDTVTIDVVKTALEDQLRTLQWEVGAGAGSPFVVSQLTGAYFQIPSFLDAQHPVSNGAEAEAYVERVAALGRLLDQETQRIGEDAAANVIAPDFAIAGAIRQLGAYAGYAPADDVLVRSLRRRIADVGDLSESERAGFLSRVEGSVREVIQPAYRRQIEALQAVLPRSTHDAGVWKQPDGDAMYAAALRYYTTTMMAPDEARTIGVELVRSLTSEVDALLRSQGMTAGSVAERLQALSRRPDLLYPDTDAGREHCLRDASQIVTRMIARMPAVSGVHPRAEVRIERVPPEIEADAPWSSYQPAPADASGPGKFSLNLRSMAAWPKFALPTLLFHEVAPGHHWQISTAQEAELPFIRSTILGFNAYSEGWALYSEQLADEMGMYDDNPLGRLGHMQSSLFRASRLVVDTGIHVRRWSLEQAVAYMAEAAGETALSVTAEIERYAVWPGQACGYMIGREAINRMRDRARSSLGTRFDLKGFHDSVLTSGSAPLTVIELVVQAWTASLG